MPSVRKLRPAEQAVAEQRPLSARARIAREYDAYLTDFVVGDHGRAEVGAGEVRAQVRSRLQAAARRRGLALRFRPGPGPALIFRVEVAAPAAARPTPQPAGEVVQRSDSGGQPETAQATRAQPTAAGVDRRPDGKARQQKMMTHRPLGRRETPTERYHTMLPRWMRDGPPAHQRERSKRRTR